MLTLIHTFSKLQGVPIERQSVLNDYLSGVYVHAMRVYLYSSHGLISLFLYTPKCMVIYGQRQHVP